MGKKNRDNRMGTLKNRLEFGVGAVKADRQAKHKGGIGRSLAKTAEFRPLLRDMR
jgi:hypothetical protein